MFTPHDILLSMSLTLGFAVGVLLTAALVWRYCKTRHGQRSTPDE
ncbi:hypothetical protein [Pseudogulbenkiania subflava]|uniref:Uncharacterized protein n=1 Tax=Pseudogulbenkiania subflava DSM 22618 TaxID=1123014 RepID=A0A1Y6BK87_9NEIS|nr:hypothetical protein [Pseudogulbenkiania subflava]SMF13829.1 hypothetical protein SAMN02745746_01509 [Pseudogulbenkiania subflava DSM 22618]